MVESVLNEIGNTKPMRWMLGRLARRQDLRKDWEDWEEMDDELRDEYDAPREFPKGKIKHTTSDAEQYAKDNDFYSDDETFRDDKSFEHGRRYRDFDYWRADDWDDRDSGMRAGLCDGYGQAMMAAIKDYLATHKKDEINEGAERQRVLKGWSPNNILDMFGKSVTGFDYWALQASIWGRALDANYTEDKEKLKTFNYQPVEYRDDNKFYVYSVRYGEWMVVPFNYDALTPEFINKQ
jgi:hypothetical protein